MTNTTHNGWKNKETWLVNVWYGDYISELGEIDADTYESTVAEMIEETIEQNGPVRDLFNCAWFAIDWYELAANTAE